jgi:hypothetical protein
MTQEKKNSDHKQKAYSRIHGRQDRQQVRFLQSWVSAFFSAAESRLKACSLKRIACSASPNPGIPHPESFY